MPQPAPTQQAQGLGPAKHKQLDIKRFKLGHWTGKEDSLMEGVGGWQVIAHLTEHLASPSSQLPVS